MRLLLIPVFALALVLAACSSTSKQPATAHYQTGSISSKWGDLPTYSPTPEPFAIRLERPDPNLSGEATVDLLLNRDGRVKDWDVVSSEDNNAFKRRIALWVNNHRMGPRLAASDPAPYVLRITFAFIEPAPSRDQYHQDRSLSGPW
jgi:outer membrane biosynthesis protein TonB